MRRALGCIAAGVIFTACSATDTPTRPLTPGDALNVQGGAAGATLQASKTVDICADESGGNWTYSGVVSVWNLGATDAYGLHITDYIQNKTGAGQFQNAILALNSDESGIPAYTPEENAYTFNYSVDAAPLSGDIRNSAVVTIINHSGGKTSGPNPKATYSGTLPPPVCRHIDELGCSLSYGYWATHPSQTAGDWPAGFSPANTFFLSGQTWQGVLDTPVGGNGYYNLAHQYIGAVLNQANGAFVPSGLQGIIDQATAWFATATPVTCSTPGSCSLQVTWAGILEEFNLGTYPGGPPSCDAPVGNDD